VRAVDATITPTNFIPGSGAHAAPREESRRLGTRTAEALFFSGANPMSKQNPPQSMPMDIAHAHVIIAYNALLAALRELSPNSRKTIALYAAEELKNFATKQ
jgi:hypothetical protein